MVEGVPTRIQHSILLVLAVTLHNMQEDLAVGVAFGALATVREYSYVKEHLKGRYPTAEYTVGFKILFLIK
ncbi:MAG TPA: hypothetical protein VKY40_03390 [Halanaerobiales bacterium]|nr:hypothetical protein [Halanaerobiales bacterium]